MDAVSQSDFNDEKLGGVNYASSSLMAVDLKGNQITVSSAAFLIDDFTVVNKSEEDAVFKFDNGFIVRLPPGKALILDKDTYEGKVNIVANADLEQSKRTEFADNFDVNALQPTAAGVTASEDGGNSFARVDLEILDAGVNSEEFLINIPTTHISYAEDDELLFRDGEPFLIGTSTSTLTDHLGSEGLLVASGEINFSFGADGPGEASITNITVVEEGEEINFDDVLTITSTSDADSIDYEIFLANVEEGEGLSRTFGVTIDAEITDVDGDIALLEGVMSHAINYELPGLEYFV